jgi:hypothetical protein
MKFICAMRRSGGESIKSGEETAYFLDLTVNSEKPIVLIGAQRYASEKDFDGPRNIPNAAWICVSPEDLGPGGAAEVFRPVGGERRRAGFRGGAAITGCPAFSKEDVR